MTPRYLSLALLTLGLAPVASAVPARLAHVEVELISETTSLARGGPPSRVALRLRPDPGWHVYWINPGDSGLATSLRWSLPDSVEAFPIEWPRPHAHAFGELTNYGYAEEVLHLVPISVAADWPAGKPVRLEAEAKWLVCEEVCIPGKADLALELPVAASPKPDPQRAAAFARARAELPREAPPAFSAVNSQGKTVQLSDLRGKFVVLEWTNNECPFVKKHYASGNMQALQKEAADRRRRDFLSKALASGHGRGNLRPIHQSFAGG